MRKHPTNHTNRVPSQLTVIRDKKRKALALTTMFKKRIEQNLFQVKSVGWWPIEGTGEVQLRIVCDVKELEDWNTLEDLDNIPE